MSIVNETGQMFLTDLREKGTVLIGFCARWCGT